MEMPSRDEVDSFVGFSGGRVGGAAAVSCSWEEGSAQHLKRAVLCTKMENTKLDNAGELANQRPPWRRGEMTLGRGRPRGKGGEGILPLCARTGRP